MSTIFLVPFGVVGAKLKPILIRFNFGIQFFVDFHLIFVNQDLIYVHLCKQTSSNCPIRITPPFGAILICPFVLRHKYDIPKLHYNGHLFL